MRQIKVFVSIITLALSSVTHAGLGDPILAGSGGHVYLTFTGYEAAYTNTLALHSPITSGDIFVNKTSLPGAIYDLGYFPVGTPLVFSIRVHDTAQTYYSGAPSANPDNVAHAFLDFLPGEVVNVGFEDLWNGGDLDYNDLRFSVSNVRPSVVPEPSTFILMLAAFIAVGWTRRLSRYVRSTTARKPMQKGT